MKVFNYIAKSTKMSLTVDLVVNSHIELHKSKYRFDEVKVGQSIFFVHQWEFDPVPIEARTAASATNRRHGKTIFVFIKHKQPKMLEIARIR